MSELHRSSLGNGRSTGLKGVRMLGRDFQDGNFVADRGVTIGAIVIVGLTIAFVILGSY